MLNLRLNISITLVFALIFVSFISEKNRPYLPNNQYFRKDSANKEIELSFGMDTLAAFPGGNEAWKNYIFKNLRYPITAQKLGQSGKVYLNFIVLKTGEITNIVVSKNTSRSLANEIITLVKKIPKWTPAILNGKPVNSNVNMPFTFTNMGVINR